MGQNVIGAIIMDIADVLFWAGMERFCIPIDTKKNKRNALQNILQRVSLMWGCIGQGPCRGAARRQQGRSPSGAGGSPGTVARAGTGSSSPAGRPLGEHLT